MPGYATSAGTMVVFILPAVKFRKRYTTIGFEHSAALDDGDIWAVAFAISRWSPAAEWKIR